VTRETKDSHHKETTIIIIITINVSNIPGNHEVSELQKTAILGTAHILRKVLTIEPTQELEIQAP
jgi:hypothetical protein